MMKASGGGKLRPRLRSNGGRYRTRTCDFYRVKVKKVHSKPLPALHFKSLENGL